MIIVCQIITLTVNWTRQSIQLRKDMIEENPRPKIPNNNLVDSVILEQESDDVTSDNNNQSRFLMRSTAEEKPTANFKEGLCNKQITEKSSDESFNR